MQQDFYSRSTQDILKSLQKHYKILVMFHPSEPANKRIYVVNNFSPTANMIYFHTVTGRDITHLIDSNVLTQYVGIDFSQDNEFLQKQTIQTQIDSLKERTIQFSPDYSWEWHF